MRGWLEWLSRRPDEDTARMGKFSMDAQSGGLMGLLKRFIVSDIDEFAANDVRLKIIGDWRALAPDVVALIEDAIARTAHNRRTTLAVALNYGAQDELVRAAKAAAAEGEISAETIAAHLDTADMPPLDLLIRTSGEMRISNYLLWQVAYAEFYSTSVYWPDFGKEELRQALIEYGKRQRRFGRVEL